MRKLVRSVANILIVIFGILFLLSLLYFVHGSFEISPSEEEQAQIREATVFLMFIFGILSITCIGIRIQLKRK